MKEVGPCLVLENCPLKFPGVEVNLMGDKVTVKGPKGELTKSFPGNKNRGP